MIKLYQVLPSGAIEKIDFHQASLRLTLLLRLAHCLHLPNQNPTDGTVPNARGAKHSRERNIVIGKKINSLHFPARDGGNLVWKEKQKHPDVRTPVNTILLRCASLLWGEIITLGCVVRYRCFHTRSVA